MKLINLAAGMLAASLMSSAQASIALDEGFDSVSGLGGSGWVFSNASTPVGQAWFQGNSGIFPAFSGATDSYVAANFLSTDEAGGVVDNWLISPELILGAGMALSFYTRTAGSDFFDGLEVRFSSGAGTGLGGFTTLLGSVGSAAGASYPSDWTAYTMALPTAVSGRIAFRYTVGDVFDADYIGIDSVLVSSVSVVPEPASLALVVLALLLVAAARRAPRRKPGALALAFALAVGAPMAAQAGDAMRVVRDPVTGEMRGPTAAEAAAFEKAEAQLRQRSGKPAVQAPVEVRHPDGTVETKLGDDTMMYSVVRANKDGTLAMHCLPAKEAQAFVKSSKTPSASKVKTKAGHSHE